MAKTDETVVEETVEETTATKTKTKAKSTAEKAKVYTFRSRNKYLSCSALKVQFVEGVATTTSLVVARALAKIDGVELVEE